jgi:hypothetical protein
VKESGDERRKHQRHDAAFSIETTTDEGTVVARMMAKNLSLGGLYCTSTQDFPEMTRLAVRLMLPAPDNVETEPVDVEAVVVRRQSLGRGSNGDHRYELALFFPFLGSTAKQRLQSFLGTT